MSTQIMCRICKMVTVEHPRHTCANCFEVVSRFHHFVANPRGLRWAMAVIQEELRGINTHDI